MGTLVQTATKHATETTQYALGTVRAALLVAFVMIALLENFATGVPINLIMKPTAALAAVVIRST